MVFTLGLVSILANDCRYEVTYGVIAMSDLCELFGRYFDVITDDTSWVADEAFKLRYQVYCIEQGFEDASQFKDKREFDDFDCRSAHAIIRHKPSGNTAATLRLVLPDPENLHTPFPIEQHCGDYARLVSPILQGVPRDSIAEISRFAISKDFKRRFGEAGTVAGIGPDRDKYFEQDVGGKRVIPHLILGLFAAVFRMSVERKITHWYAVMDLSLLRLLSRFGIDFVPVGDMVDYHGLRQPCLGNVEEAVNKLWEKHLDAWNLVTVDGALWPAPSNETFGVIR